MRGFLVFMLVLVLGGFFGCKPIETSLTSYQKDSIIYIYNTDTLKELVFGDSMLIESLIYCDENNRAKMRIIDSLGKKINLKVDIKDNKLTVKVKQKDWYKISLFYKELCKIKSERVTTKTIIREVKEPVNKWLIGTIILLLSVIYYLIRYKK